MPGRETDVQMIGREEPRTFRLLLQPNKHMSSDTRAYHQHIKLASLAVVLWRINQWKSLEMRPPQTSPARQV